MSFFEEDLARRAQVGTRDTRITMVRPYRLVAGRIVFDDPPPPDIDWRTAEGGHDPYAEVFVSVPSTTTPM
jgi:hypothetical protein